MIVTDLKCEMASQVDNSQYQDNARLQRPSKGSGGFACEIVDPPPEHLHAEHNLSRPERDRLVCRM